MLSFHFLFFSWVGGAGNLSHLWLFFCKLLKAVIVEIKELVASLIMHAELACCGVLY